MLVKVYSAVTYGNNQAFPNPIHFIYKAHFANNTGTKVLPKKCNKTHKTHKNTENTVTKLRKE